MAFGAETAELALRINLTGNATKGVSNLQRQITGLSKSVGRVGTGFGQITGGFAKAGLLVGGAAVTGLTAAAKAAIDFEDAFAGVKKTVNESDLRKAGLSFDALAKSFRNMATEIPIAANELAAIGETAGALGIPAKNIETFTKTVALLSVTTNLTAEAAAEDLGKVTTILGLTGKGITDFADTLVNLGNQGSSTESEIIEVTKRFAAMGKQAGLTTNQILALSSAATSLGAEPEAAGSALSRIFANMSTELAIGSDKGKAFAKVVGESVKTLRGRVRKGEALPVLLDFLKGLSGLNRVQAAKALDFSGITNVRDRNAILLMAQNLGFVNDQLKIAEESTGALSTEATKRFATVRSAIQLLKNNVIEAALTIGGDASNPKSFIGAIGNAAKKLTAFLKDPANKADLEQFGSELGQTINDINWDEVLRGARDFVGVMKTALGFAKRIFDTFNALPTELKGAVAGLLVANKLSGGLIGSGIGNVVGGLAGAAATGIGSRVPGVGKLFAQPVIVTNWPPGLAAGGLGGVAGAAGGGILGKVNKALGLLGVFAAGLGVLQTQQEVSGASSSQAAGVQQTAKVFLAQNPTTDALQRALAGVDKGINDLQANPLTILVRGDALEKLEATRASIIKQIGELQTTRVETNRGTALQGQKTQASVNQSKQAITAAQQETKRETARGDALVRAQTASSGSAIVSAIYANRPVITTNVNVSATSVTRTTTVVNRYGKTGGSRYVDGGNIREGAD